MLLKQSRCLRSVVPILLLLLSGVRSYPAGSNSSRLQCYVCGGENAEPCGDVTSKPTATSLRECPETAQGCLTQAEGKEVTRSCVDLKIKDCKTANGNSYCYCDTDACNGEPVPESISNTQHDDADDLVPRHQVANSNKFLMTVDTFGLNQQEDRQNICEGDDEDRCEGSGTQPEDRSGSDDLLIHATYDTTTQFSQPTSSFPTITNEDTTTGAPAEKTTQGPLEAPSAGTNTMIALETTPNPNKEPSRGSASTCLVPLLMAAVISVRFGNEWLLWD